MSYTDNNHSKSFKSLDLQVKRKTNEIAGLLLAAGFEKEIVEMVASANARLWIYYNNSFENLKAIHLHLVPHPNGWALITEDALSVFFIYSSKNDALIKARTYAKMAKLRLYIHSPSGSINDYESFVVNRPQAISEPIKKHETKEEVPLVRVENKREALRTGKWLSINPPLSLVKINKEEDSREQQLSLGI